MIWIKSKNMLNFKKICAILEFSYLLYCYIYVKNIFWSFENVCIDYSRKKHLKPEIFYRIFTWSHCALLRDLKSSYTGHFVRILACYPTSTWHISHCEETCNFALPWDCHVNEVFPTLLSLDNDVPDRG